MYTIVHLTRSYFIYQRLSSNAHMHILLLMNSQQAISKFWDMHDLYTYRICKMHIYLCASNYIYIIVSYLCRTSVLLY